MRGIKFLSLLLASLTVITAVSCASDTGGAASDTSARSGESSSESEAETTEISDDLPATDLSGWQFRIFNTADFQKFAHVDEANGEVVNDAVYNANLNVEERFNVEIVTVLTDDTGKTKDSILSGSDDFDVSMMHDVTAGTQAQSGLFLNVRELPHLNFEKPWWPEFTVDTLTVANKMYTISNYMTYLGMDWTRVIFFNIDRLNDYNLESPYDLVRNGTWTFDKWISMTKDIYEDSDGDGQNEYGDFHGFALTGPYYCWLEAFDIEPYAKDAETVLRLDINSDRMVTLCQKLYSWLYENNGCYYSSSDGGNYAENNYLGMFAAGRSLFTYGVLQRLIIACRDTDINYGILPMPKLTDTQQEYYSGCTDRFIVVPKTNSNIDNTGLIIEAMSAQGYKEVLPAYYDTALKWKYSNDKDSSEMLDIIFKNRRISLEYVYCSSGQYATCLSTVVMAKGADWTSYYAKTEKQHQKMLEKTVEFFTKPAE